MHRQVEKALIFQQFNWLLEQIKLQVTQLGDSHVPLLSSFFEPVLFQISGFYFETKPKKRHVSWDNLIKQITLRSALVTGSHVFRVLDVVN